MSRMYECSQVVYSTVEVLLRRMPKHQHTSLSCLGAVLAHSYGIGVRHAFVVEQVQQDETRQTIHAFKSHYQYFEGDTALNWQPMQLLHHWCDVVMFIGACY